MYESSSLEDGEIRVGLVGRAGSAVFGGEHFNGTRDESAVIVTGIFHAAVVVVQPPEVGTGTEVPFSIIIWPRSAEAGYPYCSWAFRHASTRS